MENSIKRIYIASKEVLRKKGYGLIFISVAIIFFGILFFLPVFAIPGNDIKFQGNVFTINDYLIMIFLSLTIGLLISMQVYNFKMKRSAKVAGKGILGGFSGFVVGIFGTASCASCIAVVFGFLGAGTIFFLVENQGPVVFISSLLMITSIYLTSKNILNGCEECK